MFVFPVLLFHLNGVTFWTGNNQDTAHRIRSDEFPAGISSGPPGIDAESESVPRHSPNPVVDAITEVAEHPSWSCHVIDQLSYCVYSRSLCLDHDAHLVLLTGDPIMQGRPVQMLNNLSPSPWHAPDIDKFSQTSYGQYDIPFRSFFSSARYAPTHSFAGAEWMSGWSLVAAFDAENYNLYHYMNKLHAAFIARIYELGGLKDRSMTSDGGLLQRMRSTNSEFDYAYLFRPPPTSWQKNYGEICLGKKTKFIYSPRDSVQGEHVPVCFEKAIIPGAALYLAEGLTSSILFREIAAEMKGIRVPKPERNLITIFIRKGNRRILNMQELVRALRDTSPALKVTSVDWDGDTDFETQAMHMARTRMMISTHGSVLNHNAFMELAGVVIEINAFQFVYPLDNQIILSRGHHYIRYEEDLFNTKHQGLQYGYDPFPGMSTQYCMRNVECMHARRDADVRVNVSKFMPCFQEALSLIT